ncbi:tetratricopeptide repeat protein [Pseudomonas sp. o96-267]|uniref:tetratricopeptide repeat protein n=1 Tax=Pseudomonas sp. o96-267 TaxID=2479853 RepID=UPI0015AAA10A|nr:tetratricopeptide repeat protein [Pseudomonas sp. o96-267]
MDSLSATKKNAPRTRLLNPWMILLVAGFVVALLVLSYKSEEVFLPDADDTPDAVAISYTELLIKAHPEDDKLRLRLIDQLIQVGDFTRARKYLEELQGRLLSVTPFYFAMLDVLRAQADPEGVSDEQRAALVDELRALKLADLDNGMLERLARYSLEMGGLDIAVGAYQALAERDSERRAHWLGEAAIWSLANNDQSGAAQIYQQLAAEEGDRLKRAEYLREAFDALRAANQPEQAAELLAQHLDELDADPASLDWLAAGVDAAQGGHRYDLAETFIQRWLSLKRDDPRALSADFHLSLASGAIDRAWQLAPELLALTPDNYELMGELARLAEWTGHTQQALNYWVQMLAEHEDPALRERVWRYSLQLFDFDQVVNALAAIDQHRQMSDLEVDTLVYSHETRGTPDEAESWLRAYLQRYPNHLFARQRLRMLLENTQQFRKEVEQWKILAERMPLTTKDRIRWAKVHWNLFEPDQAWQVLADADPAQLDDPEFWQLRADLAWQLERDEDVRASYERLLSLNVPLDLDDEDRLVRLYWDIDPKRTLQLLIDSWHRTGRMNRLVVALQLAETMRDWDTLKALLAEAEKSPNGRDNSQYWIARAAVVAQEGQFDLAQEYYKQALALFPDDNLVRQRILWFYVDNAQRDLLAQLLPQWRALAVTDSRLWLPYATGYMMLNNPQEALRWFRQHLKSNPSDRLVLAAYADAAEAAGYEDLAWRLRRQLLRDMDLQRVTSTPEGYAMYLRLLAGSQGTLASLAQAKRQWNGEQATLQVWFEHFLERLDASNQAALKDDWLAWGATRGLQVGSYDEIQQALRNDNHAQMERLLARGGLDAAHEVEVLSRLGHDGEALAAGLSALGDDQPESIRQQLLYQTTGMLERSPQGLQLGWHKTDFGDLDLKGPRLQVARYLGDDWYADLQLEQGRYNSRNLNNSVLGSERNVKLETRRELDDGELTLILDSSLRDDDDRHGLGIERSWRLSSRDELGLGFDWHREVEDTGLLRALSMRDSVRLRGQHGFSARDQLTWSLAHNRYSSRNGDDLGSGHSASLEWGHMVFFDDPSWLLRSGVDYQRNSVQNRVPDALLSANGGAYIPFEDDPEATIRGDELMQSRYGQLYVASTLRRGFPGALNRTRPQFTWMIDTVAGWQWTERQFNYGINVGVGVELFGDDELAVTLGYQSAPRGGEGDPGGSLGITYSTRFGR